jgi:hypothetical protein
MTREENNARNRDWYARNIDAQRKRGRERYQRRVSSDPEGVKEHRRKYAQEHSEDIKNYKKRYRETNIQKVLLYSAKRRSIRKAVPFSLKEEDIIVPKRCPMLGIELVFGEGTAQANSPSIDEITPGIGYVPGNVQVISTKANSMKNNATVDELRMFADWIERTYSGTSPIPAEVSFGNQGEL